MNDQSLWYENVFGIRGFYFKKRFLISGQIQQHFLCVLYNVHLSRTTTFNIHTNFHPETWQQLQVTDITVQKNHPRWQAHVHLRGCGLGPHVLPYIECSTIKARVTNKQYKKSYIVVVLTQQWLFQFWMMIAFNNLQLALIEIIGKRVLAIRGWALLFRTMLWSL